MEIEINIEKVNNGFIVTSSLDKSDNGWAGDVLNETLVAKDLHDLREVTESAVKNIFNHLIINETENTIEDK